MRTLAIGDIHGCRTALEALIALVSPAEDDPLIFLGDYVNRGPDSRGVIDFLIHLAQRRRCIFLRGNHEVMTLQARDERSRATTWRHGNGGDLLSSYGFTGQSEWWNLIPAAHWQFLERTTPYFETARHIFVHASLDPEIDLADQPDWVIYWERFETIRPHKSGKKIICGHTPSRDGEIKDVGYAACIDTAAVAGRWLTCLDANTGQYWQANQTSTTRTARLPNWQ